MSSHSFCSDFPRNAFVGVIIDPSTGTPAGRPPPQPPPPGRPASSLLAAARRLPSPTAGKQVSSTPGSRGCGSGRHTPPPGGYLGAGHCRLPSPTRWPSIPPPAARQHASLRQEGLAFPGSLPTGSGFRSPRWPPSLRRSSWVRATTDTRKHASARGQAAQGTGAGPHTAQGLWAAWLPPVPGLPPLTGCQQPKGHTSGQHCPFAGAPQRDTGCRRLATPGTAPPSGSLRPCPPAPLPASEESTPTPSPIPPPGPPWGSPSHPDGKTPSLRPPTLPAHAGRDTRGPECSAGASPQDR